MPKRTDDTKQIVVSIAIHERFMTYREYNETKEGILIKLMDMADKYKKFSTHRRQKREV